MPIAKFRSVIFQSDEVMPYYACSPREFSIFTWKPTVRTLLWSMNGHHIHQTLTTWLLICTAQCCRNFTNLT